MSEPTAYPREVPLSHAVLLPVADWSSYVLDDYGVSYVSGRWPYHRDLVRLAPDAGYRAWGNEYATARVAPEAPEMAVVALNVVVRREGVAAWVVPVTARLDLLSGDVAFDEDDLGEEEWLEAVVKAHRVLDLLAAERARRDGPERPSDPDTAYDRWSRGDGAAASGSPR